MFAFLMRQNETERYAIPATKTTITQTNRTCAKTNPITKNMHIENENETFKNTFNRYPLVIFFQSLLQF